MIANDAYMDEVMRSIAEEDKKGFEQLFKTWYVRLCIYAESIVRDRDQAEDLVQNIFCMLWEKREGVNIRESVKSYLYRSVYNAALNSLKHEKIKLAFLEFVQKYSSEDENHVEYCFDHESREAMTKEINRVVNLLPEQCKEIFILSRFVGKKSTEIAEIMNISVRTVEAQLYRAMKRLREELAYLKNNEILFLFFFKKCVSSF